MSTILRNILKYIKHLDVLFKDYNRLIYSPIDRFQIVRENLLNNS